MKKVLVTGAAGFIGSYLCSKLTDLGVEVIAIDNLSNSDSERFSRLNQGIDLINKDSIQFLRETKFKAGSFDCIFDLAYINGTKNFYERGADILEHAGKAIFHSIEFAEKNRCKLVYFSTPEAYGYPDQFPTEEHHKLQVMNIENPRWSYAIGKIFSESVLHSYAKSYNFHNFTIVRPNNAYGPLDRNHVIPDLIRKIKDNKVLEVEGNKSDTRCFCYIDDMIEQIVLLMGMEFKGDTYNLGNSTEISIEILVKEIIDVFEASVAVKYVAGKQGSPVRRVPSVEKVTKATKFMNFTSLREGLKRIKIFETKL